MKSIRGAVTILWFIVSHIAHAEIINQQIFLTHARLEFYLPKDQIQVEKKTDSLSIKTLDADVFNQLDSALNQIELDKKYFNKVEKISVQSPFGIKIFFQNKQTDMFSFYKEAEKKYVFDFWNNSKVNAEDNERFRPMTHKFDEDKQQRSKAKRDQGDQPKINLIGSDNKVLDNKVLENKKIKIIGKNSVSQLTEEKEKTETKNDSTVNNSGIMAEENSKYRDFRYGAPLIWNYAPMIPSVPSKVDIKSKTPIFLHPLLNRTFKNNPEETHIQLTINLFREEKWGLMHRSIEIFQQKYGLEKNAELFEFLKATALIKKNLSFSGKDVSLGEIKMAIAIYEEVLERTKDVLLKETILRYFVDFYNKQKDYITFLDYAKKLYIISHSNYDTEIELEAIEAILFGLAELSQIENMEKFIETSAVKQVLPPQTKIIYLSYVYLRNGRSKDVIDLYEKNKVSLQKPVAPEIIFNVAESYFAYADYNNASELFKQFIDDYGHTSFAAAARVRVALCFELLGKNPDDVLKLYEDAINNTGIAYFRYEAKVRYIGVLIGRKINLSEEDKEKIYFLELKEEEKKSLDLPLKKLLWLVRLRTFISTHDYEKALTYLKTIPFQLMLPPESRSFFADGSEVIHGLMTKYYSEMNFSEVTQLWEEYKNIYFDKTTINPLVYYKVAYSYLKMGLPNNTDGVIKQLKEIKGPYYSYYPKWIDGGITDIQLLVPELDIMSFMQQERYDDVLKICQEVITKNPEFIKMYYYMGYVAYKKERYEDAVNMLETFFIKKEDKMLLNFEEVYNLSIAYIESIYKTGKNEKFEQIASAVIEDAESLSKTSNLLNGLKERVSYLVVEYLLEKSDKENFVRIKNKITSFQEKFPISIYGGRVRYLLGVLLSKNGAYIDAEKVFDSLIKDKDIPQYLKEISKIELSSLKIYKKQTL